PGALWSHAQRATSVEVGQGATASPHRMDIEDGDFHGAASDNRLVCGARLLITQRDICRSPAHVKRNSAHIASVTGYPKSPHDSPSWARHHRVHSFLVGACS